MGTQHMHQAGLRIEVRLIQEMFLETR